MEKCLLHDDLYLPSPATDVFSTFLIPLAPRAIDGGELLGNKGKLVGIVQHQEKSLFWGSIHH